MTKADSLGKRGRGPKHMWRRVSGGRMIISSIVGKEEKLVADTVRSADLRASSSVRQLIPSKKSEG